MEDMENVKKVIYKQNININKKTENIQRNKNEILELKSKIIEMQIFSTILSADFLPDELEARMQ